MRSAHRQFVDARCFLFMSFMFPCLPSHGWIALTPQASLSEGAGRAEQLKINKTAP